MNSQKAEAEKKKKEDAEKQADAGDAAAAAAAVKPEVDDAEKARIKEEKGNTTVFCSQSVSTTWRECPISLCLFSI
jgi:hypothetical protein